MRLAASILAPAVALAGCHEAALAPRLLLSVAAARSVITVGDSTTVAISLRNLGTDSVSLSTGGCGVLPYVTAQPGGQIVYPGGGDWFCIDVIRRFTLAPGAEQADTFLVRGATYAVGAYPPVSLAPGRYLIYATFSASTVSLRSESVPLTVQ